MDDRKGKEKKLKRERQIEGWKEEKKSEDGRRERGEIKYFWC